MSKVYQILTNMDCNLRCKYCYEQDKARGANTINDIKAFITAAIEESVKDADPDTMEGIGFEFVGGETFLHMDVVNAAVEHIFAECHSHAVKQAPQLSFSTNGTLFNKPDVQDFIKKYGRYLNIGISIDGTGECHNSNRVDISGNGSYDQAVAGYRWLLSHVCKKHLSAKATFNHDTIRHYADGVINLIELGFISIIANTVFEEVWTQEDTKMLIPQMYRIVDYLIDHDLVDKVAVMQVNPFGRATNRMPIGAPKTQNHCGSCTSMRCIGFNGVVYGCHRFATMPAGISIGYITDNGMEITNTGFIEEMTRQYEAWPEDCKKCPFGHICASCSALPYEGNGDAAVFFARKGQCGFTIARAAAVCYLASRLQEKTKHVSKR